MGFLGPRIRLRRSCSIYFIERLLTTTRIMVDQQEAPSTATSFTRGHVLKSERCGRCTKLVTRTRHVPLTRPDLPVARASLTALRRSDPLN